MTLVEPFVELDGAIWLQSDTYGDTFYITILLFDGAWGWVAGKCKNPACFDQAVFVTRNRDAYATDRFEQRYPAFNSIACLVHMYLPFVTVGQASYWRTNEDFEPIATIPVPNLPAFISGATQKTRIMSRVSTTIRSILY